MMPAKPVRIAVVTCLTAAAAVMPVAAAFQLAVSVTPVVQAASSTPETTGGGALASAPGAGAVVLACDAKYRAAC